MGFDYAGLRGADLKYGGILGRSRTIGDADIPNQSFGEATWKTEERRRAYEESPEGQARLQQLAMQQQAAEDAAVAREMKLKEAEAAKYDQWRTSQLLKQAYDVEQGKEKTKFGEGLDETLAQRLYNAGIEAYKQGVNPKLADDIMKQANDYRRSAMETKKNNLYVQGLVTDRAAEIYGSVSDEDSWNRALPELAKIGIVPPSTKYSPEIQAKAEQAALLSNKVRGAENLMLRQETAAQKVELDNQKFEEEKRKNLEKQRNEALKQHLASVPRTTKPDDEAFRIEKLPKIEDLSSQDRLEAAGQIEPLSKFFLITGQAKDAPTARTMAIQDIQNRVTEDGKLLPMVTVEKPTSGNTDIAATVKASGVAYEPDKYDYRVVDGKVQRKAK